MCWEFSPSNVYLPLTHARTCTHAITPTKQDREAGPQWDCETIVSTFSTLDNHPSVIAEPSLGRRKGGRNKQRGAASAMQGTVVLLVVAILSPTQNPNPTNH